MRLQAGVEVVGLLDDNHELKGCRLDGVSVLGSIDLLPELFRDGVEGVFIGVGGLGDNRPRQELFERVRKLGLPVISLVHPSAIIASGVKIQEGTVVMAGVIIN